MLRDDVARFIDVGQARLRFLGNTAIWMDLDGIEASGCATIYLN
jgi:hypothetical protein